MNSTTSRQAALICLVTILVVPLHSADAAQATRPDNHVTDWTPPTGTTPGWIRVPGTGPVTPGPGVPVTPATCAAETKTWTVGSFSCEGSLAEAAAPTTLTATDTTDPNHGEASYTCSRRHGWQQRPNATCGPTECPSATVTWSVDGGPQCTGTTRKTDIASPALTDTVTGTRANLTSVAAVGTFVCNADASWSYQGDPADSCPKDCDTPAPRIEWDEVIGAETWICGLDAAGAAPAPGRTQWVTTDVNVVLNDTTSRESGQRDEATGTAYASCNNVAGQAKGTFEIATSPAASCTPSGCASLQHTWARWINPIPASLTDTSGTPGRYYLGCAARVHALRTPAVGHNRTLSGHWLSDNGGPTGGGGYANCYNGGLEMHCTCSNSTVAGCGEAHYPGAPFFVQ